MQAVTKLEINLSSLMKYDNGTGIEISVKSVFKNQFKVRKTIICHVTHSDTPVTFYFNSRSMHAVFY